MKITTAHPASSYGVPVILGDGGDVMDYPDGLRAVKLELGMTSAEVGELCGVSGRTVDGWIRGFPPSAAALNVLRDVLESSGRTQP